jgi:hypothetical protein
MPHRSHRYSSSNTSDMTASDAAFSAICSARLQTNWDAWGLLLTPTVATEVLFANARRIFMFFSTGWVVSHGYGVYIDFNVTVSVCGLTISPGDLLHGDESGLVSVPIDIAGDVVTRADAVREEEAEYFDFLESDRFNMKELKRRIIPHE